MYLLDTNVISELCKGKQANRNVLAWAGSIPAPNFFLSAITVQEIETGILLIERRESPLAGLLRDWFENQILPTFAGRILAIDAEVARRSAKFHVPVKRADRDALIAATALVHGLTVVTRNTGDFENTGVHRINPWAQTFLVR